ncbi:uncharacterized protein BO97DRAFT_163224 [Aspergillus homomorphus CBS 101889]|uniref:Uncharacterized protein n=1 Tax=Aspergillus homomorphus (strain CBS 101889) TaxID=1450537 RepID=A0A395HQE9_ASPHC|nr:hypothetical protein BO97DRAFT_163224 [Aspergillus homomorphus CBS 101889]RAL09663.1 hypothetical protein BO97DRAFT_163224 [Aspergillus homomorphus CBS 101889]
MLHSVRVVETPAGLSLSLTPLFLFLSLSLSHNLLPSLPSFSSPLHPSWLRSSPPHARSLLISFPSVPLTFVL